MYPIVSDNPRVQEHYLKCRYEGTSHTLAEMFALAQPPQAQDDTTWLKAIDPGGNQFADNPAMGDAYAEEARAAGDNISGAVYVHGIADHPGDRRAWVRNLGDVKRVCEERGMSCEGAVKVKARNDLAPAPSVAIADDLVHDEMMERMEVNPELKPSEELFQECRDAIKPQWAD